MKGTVIMGLGNPGAEFEGTYHNAGMLAVRRLAAHGATFRQYKDLFLYASADGTAFVLPLVYMNDSGRAAKEALKVLDAAPADLVVIHDDSDISIGEFKSVSGGRAAGHKGIQSIIDSLKTDDFRRIRIGIRHPEEARRKKAGDFVLSPITPADKEALEEVFSEISSVLEKK